MCDFLTQGVTVCFASSFLTIFFLGGIFLMSTVLFLVSYNVYNNREKYLIYWNACLFLWRQRKQILKNLQQATKVDAEKGGQQHAHVATMLTSRALKITYTGGDEIIVHKIHSVYLPFDGDLIEEAAEKQVFLTQPGKEPIEITQDAGIPYFITGRHLGGKLSIKDNTDDGDGRIFELADDEIPFDRRISAESEAIIATQKLCLAVARRKRRAEEEASLKEEKEENEEEKGKEEEEKKGEKKERGREKKKLSIFLDE